MYLLVRFSASRKWIFLKIHTFRPTYIAYKWYKLGYDRTTIKDTWLAELCIISAVSQLPVDGFS